MRPKGKSDVLRKLVQGSPGAHQAGMMPAQAVRALSPRSPRGSEGGSHAHRRLLAIPAASRILAGHQWTS